MVIVREAFLLFQVLDCLQISEVLLVKLKSLDNLQMLDQELFVKSIQSLTKYVALLSMHQVLIYVFYNI